MNIMKHLINGLKAAETLRENVQSLTQVSRFFCLLYQSEKHSLDWAKNFQLNGAFTCHRFPKAKIPLDLLKLLAHLFCHVM